MPKAMNASYFSLSLMILSAVVFPVHAEDSLAVKPQLLHYEKVTAEELNSVYGLSVEEKVNVANPDAAPPEYWYPEYSLAIYDLNADGEDELFVETAGSGFCGSHGCDVSLYFKDGKHGYKKRESWLAYRYIEILDSKHNAYYDLKFAVPNNPEGRRFAIRTWDGQNYALED